MDQYSFNPMLHAASMQRQQEILRLKLKIEKTRRNLIKKQIDEIPQMSDRQLLEAIYKLLLRRE